MSPPTLPGDQARFPLRGALSLGRRGALELRALVELRRAGMLGGSPRETVAGLRALARYGQLGAAPIVAALRHGERVGLIDELGSLTFGELNSRSDAIAAALGDRGVGSDDCIGILCRNHRGFLDATFAAGKLGARALYLNTDFAGAQLQEVCEREGVTLLVHDEEYDGLLGGRGPRHGSVLAWHEGDAGDRPTLERLIAEGRGRTPRPPARPARVVLLTSGTTGAPKGAPRSSSMSIVPIGALLSKVPYRAGEATYVAPPMFHGVGYTQTLLSVSLGCTTITRRRFRPEEVLAAISEHRPSALVVVPVMLQRIVTLLEPDGHSYQTDSLRLVFVSGSQLDAELVRRAERTIGSKLYNFYGSTEVAYATFATPADLHAAPGCAGRPPFGATVRLYDEEGRRVSGAGAVGRIFVGNTFQFDGYTGGGTKETIDGLMSTGDVGHFDAGGRLFVDGRDDEMIVSGGENVFPAEVEELLATHPAIEEAAVIGVPDPEFHQRLAAFVVLRAGMRMTEDEVREFVRASLARFKVPRDVVFLSELPRNPAGKILKRSLRERHGQPVVSSSG
jgi:fatty-acyl-CoA synthase